MMKLSIVIPVYNVADYLPRAMVSLLCQDLRDCEIILVDDGSTDGKSGALCDEYAAAHPQTVQVIHKQNGGLGDARNVGAAAAKGEYLFFLDSDDYVTPDMLLKVRARLEQDDSDIIIFGFQTVRDGQKTGEQIDTLPTDRTFALKDVPALLMATPNACNKLWKRSFLEAAGIWYPARVWYEDVRTVTKLYAVAQKISFLPEPFYCYVDRPGSITKNVNIDRNREIMDAFDDILGWYREAGLYAEYERELEALTVFHVLLTASVRVIRIDRRTSLTAEFREYTKSHFPNYRRNPYTKSWPFFKRLALTMVRCRAYGLLALLFRIK